MSKKSLCIARGRDFFESVLNDPALVPVSFVYDGRKYQGLSQLELLKKACDGSGLTMLFRLDDCMEAELSASFCPEFGEAEYTLWFRNTGDHPSKVLKNVFSYDGTFDGSEPVLRGCLGDHENKYAPYEYDLLKNDAWFECWGGRATHIKFPYFDLVHGDGGTLIALGWAGTWNALFASLPQGGVKARLQSCNEFCASLMPGEKVRTGLVVLLPYSGRNGDDAANLWREWWMKHNMPRANAQGDPIRPFSTCGFSADTGLPNSDGSISERSFTWKPTLDKIIKEGLVPDFRWFDAGWYPDPAGNTVETDWWGTVGTWEIDRIKWPDNSFRESNEACHAAGMKVLAWFEPERVTHVEDLVKNHGYKAEWGLQGNWCVTNNLGNEECFNWTLNRITKMMLENEVDLFREDNNSDPDGSWRTLDRTEKELFGVERTGINENKSIQAHYRLWDSIIDFCGKHGKCTFVDSCASGGGRNDIESMRRGLPFMRSDFDRTTTSLRLSMTTTFCKWIPFHGSATKEVAWQLDPVTGKGSDPYIIRASLLPLYLMSGVPFTHNKELDFDLLRRNFNEWKSVRHLLVRDMYVLTTWHHENDRLGWTAIAYDAPELGESLLLAFRQEECQTDSYTAKLPFAEDGKNYTLNNADTGETVTMRGTVLREQGITVKLDVPRSSALIRINVCK